MTKTTQPCSWVTLNKTRKDLTINKPETEDNKSLLLLVFDNLNELYEKLNRLNYLMVRKIMEHNLYRKEKRATK